MGGSDIVVADEDVVDVDEDDEDDDDDEEEDDDDKDMGLEKGGYVSKIVKGELSEINSLSREAPSGCWSGCCCCKAEILSLAECSSLRSSFCSRSLSRSAEASFSALFFQSTEAMHPGQSAA